MDDADLHDAARRPIRIVHVITGLARGGAELTMYNVVRGLDRTRFESQVVSLSRHRAIAGLFTDAGVALTILDAHRFRSFGLGPLLSVIRLLRKEKPDLVQTWMYHADLVGGVAGRVAGVPVVWRIGGPLRDASEQPASRRRTRFVGWLCAVLSRVVPRAIVSCSRAYVDLYVRHGYDRQKFRVIRNGVDVNAFKPDVAARAALRAELGIDERSMLIGMVARFDPAKDHATFFAAARNVLETHPDARFLVCGPGLEPENAVVTDAIISHGLKDSMVRLGSRDDIARVFAALDIHVLSSRVEGFGNVIAEAMATCVPCVATDLADLRQIVGDTGRIVPAGDPAAMAAAIRELIDLPETERHDLGLRARQRISEHFTLSAAIARYEALYEEVAGARDDSEFPDSPTD
jgi:glycosyltransferase involved in cell wall biosynthesis